MVRLALNGDYQNALTIHHKFTELFKLLFVDGNPAGVKAMRQPCLTSRISTNSTSSLTSRTSSSSKMTALHPCNELVDDPATLLQGCNGLVDDPATPLQG